MSADLFAAFGEPQLQQENPQEVSKPMADLLGLGLETAPESNLRNFRRISSEPNSPARRNDRKGVNVLFDASDEGEVDEEFGEFEGQTNSDNPILHFEEALNHHALTTGIPGSAVESSTAHGIDLLDLPKLQDSESQSQKESSLRTSSSVKPGRLEGWADDEDEWGNFEKVGGSTSSPLANDVPVPGLASTRLNDSNVEDGNDSWEVFEDGPSDHSDGFAKGKDTAMKADTILSPAVATDALEKPESHSTIRPTNIPPPATLLELLPRVFQDLRKIARQETCNEASLGRRIAQVFVVAGRIMGGRSLRWKRDIILAQSTKIGPATLGKSGGMKLISLDRTEGLKEEREASEAVAGWSRNAYHFNAVLAKSNTHRPLMSLSPKPIVMIATGPGVLYASQACVLCGIRRNERISGVDVDINDLFGEYWIEHWGHTDCRNFWTSYKDLLQRR